MTIFLAHPKSATLEQLRKWSSLLKEPVVYGKDDYGLYKQQYGSYSSWGESVARRKLFGSNEYVYSMIVVPTQFIGLATADIVTQAVLISRPCNYLTTDGKLLPIEYIEQVSHDWSEMYELHYKAEV